MARGYYGRSVIAAWDWRGGTPDVALGLRLRQRAAALSESQSLAVLRAGQPQPVDRRRGRRRPPGNRLRLDGGRRRRQGALLDRPPPRRRVARGRSRSRAARPRGLRHPRERGRDGRARHARRGAVRCGDGRDSLGRAAGRRRGPRPGGRHRSPPSRRGILDATSPRSACSTSAASASPRAPPSANFAVWWDADPLREILDSNWIGKWNWTTAAIDRLLTATGAMSNNGSKATPALSADILGDWREEVIWRAADNESLRIYTTTDPGGEPAVHADARSAVSRRDRLAERRLQPAAASVFLHRRQDGAAAETRYCCSIESRHFQGRRHK